MGSADSWRHHVIPQFYLRAFTNADKKLHRLEKEFGHTKWLSPRGVGFKADFHRLPGRKATLEPVLDQQVEHPLAQHHRVTLAALRIGGNFPLEEREWLNRMLVHQLMRLPHQRRRLEDLTAQLAGMSAFAALRDADHAETASREHLRMISGLDTPVIRGIAGTVSQFQVSFLRARPGVTFWTGDVPVVIAQAAPDGGRTRSSLDLPLGGRGTQLYFPLAKDMLAMFHHGTLPMPPHKVAFAEEEHTAWMNARILANAEREVYSALEIRVDRSLLDRLRSGGSRVDLD